MGILPLLVLLSLCARSFAATAERSENAVSPVEQFKAFIASPPAIESLVFREKLRQDMTKPERYDGSFGRSTNFALWKAAWQKDALLFYAATSENEQPQFLPGRIAISIFDGQYWFLDGRNYMQTCTAPFGSMDNPVTLSVAFKLPGLNQVLQGGIMHVRPGDIVWNGDQFVANDIPSPFKVRFTVKGRLVEKDGRPAELLVDYRTGHTSADIFGQWKIEYSYDDPLEAAFFPSVIVGHAIMEGREVESYHYAISKLKLAENPLVLATFDPRRSLVSQPMSILMFTNDAMYALSPDGTISRIPRTFSPGIASNSRKEIGRAVALGGLGGINLFFLALLFKTRTRKPNSTTQPKESYDEK